MNDSSKLLKARELDSSLQKFDAAREVDRPVRGWLEAIRTSMGLTLQETASKSGITRQAIASLELAEREDRITLKRLREVAATLDCDLVYALVPKTGTLEGTLERQLAKHAQASRTMEAEGAKAPPSLAVGPEPQSANPHPVEVPTDPSRPADRPGGLLLWW